MKQRYAITGLLTGVIVVCQFLILQGCSDRLEQPVTLADSSLIYPAKTADGINATIELCRYIDRKTGQRVDAGDIFAIREGESINAMIDLTNRILNSSHLLMFHIDWVDASGKSVFVKRIYLQPGDSASSLQSAISIAPGRRKPGKYALRVYLFRELVAIKNFEILEEFQLTYTQRKETAKNLILYQKTDKTTGKPVENDTMFTISEKGWIRSMLDLGDVKRFYPYKLRFTFNWTGPDGKSIYKKELPFPGEDSSSVLKSSVSVSPENRQPGDYKLQLFLFDELVEEKPFELRQKSTIKADNAGQISANLILCNTADQSACLSRSPVSTFMIGEKERVHAFTEIKFLSKKQNKKSLFYMEWVDAGGQSLFRKRFEINPGESLDNISSSISISPQKRKAGFYSVKLFHFKDQIAEQKFELK